MFANACRAQLAVCAIAVTAALLGGGMGVADAAPVSPETKNSP